MKLNILKVTSRRGGYIRGGQRFDKDTRYFPRDDAARENWPTKLGVAIALDDDQADAILSDPHLMTDIIAYDTEVEGVIAPPPVDQTEAVTALIADIPRSDSGFDGDWEKATKAFLRREAPGRDLGKITHIVFTRVDDRFNQIAFKLDGQPYAGQLEGIVSDED